MNVSNHYIVVSMGDPAGVGWSALIRILSEKKKIKNILTSIKKKN
ncbi:MAG: hypothetical protein OEV78_12805 [Spirochaetia bacterium]|nr:hypothetical protein [Spirochaetia bacterium]